MKALVYSLRSIKTVAKKHDIEDTATIVCCVPDMPPWSPDATPGGVGITPISTTVTIGMLYIVICEVVF